MEKKQTLLTKALNYIKRDSSKKNKEKFQKKRDEIIHSSNSEIKPSTLKKILKNKRVTKIKTHNPEGTRHFNFSTLAIKGKNSILVGISSDQILRIYKENNKIEEIETNLTGKKPIKINQKI